MKEEHPIGTTDDVPEGHHFVVEVNGREIGIFNVAGQYYALPNVCIHQNGPLCRGAISGTLEVRDERSWELAWTREGEIIVCPWHSMEFDIRTGVCLAAPQRRLPTYEVKVEHDRLSVIL